MSQTFRPDTDAQLAEAVGWVVDSGATLEVLGLGTRRNLGRPMSTDHVLDLSGLSGILDYQPAELVLTARAGTPLEDIRAALAANGQHLPFEPLDTRRLLAAPAGAGEGTLGGVVACNLAGPRRPSAGAVRDHVLGVKGVGGNGLAFKAGGKVVKNVTGFDLSKLVCGSYGTLAALSEVSIKVLPRPEKVRTVLIFGLEDSAAIKAMGDALRSRHEVSAAAHLPATQARTSTVDLVSGAGGAVTAIRVEGPEPSVAWRCESLRRELAAYGQTEELHTSRSTVLWEEMRCVAHLAEPTDRVIWRLSVPPAAAADVVGRIRHSVAVDVLYDWGGGLIWLAVQASMPDGAEEIVRGAIGLDCGGHATLMRGSPDLRRTVPPFQPQPDALAALSRRMKQSMDPAGVFNPGRMLAGV